MSDERESSGAGGLISVPATGVGPPSDERETFIPKKEVVQRMGPKWCAICAAMAHGGFSFTHTPFPVTDKPGDEP